MSVYSKIEESQDLVVEIMEKLPFRVLKSVNILCWLVLVRYIFVIDWFCYSCIARDFSRANLRLPLSALIASGGTPAMWYELTETLNRRTTWKQKHRPRRFAYGRARAGVAALSSASVDLPKGTSGPRADNNYSQIRLRIKITRL